MNKIVKAIAIGLGAILLLIVALVAYLSLVFDPNQFKSQITQIVFEKKQRTLSIEGDIKLRFFPKVGVDLGKVSLSARNSTEIFAKLDSARVSLALMPLLRKQLVVDKIALRGLNLHFQRNEKGETNIDDLLSKGASADDTTQSQKMQFDVEGIEVTDAAIQVSDQQTQFMGALQRLNFNSGRLAENTPTTIRLSTQIIAQQKDAQATDVQLEVQTGLRFNLSEQDFGFDKLSLGLNGKVQGNTLKFNLNAPQLQMKAKDLALTLAGLEANLQTRIAQGAVDLRLNAPRIAMDKASASSDNITASMTLTGEQNLSLKLNSGKITGSSKALSLDNIALDLERKQGAQLMKVNLTSALQADLEKLVFSLSKLKLNLQLHDPSLVQADIAIPLTGSLTADVKGQSIQTKLDGKIDQSQLNATLSINQFSAPQIAFNAVIDALNLDRYLPPAAPAAKPAETAGKQKTAAPVDAPIDLSALKTLQVNGKISIGKLQAKNIKVTDLQLPIKLAAGKLELNGLQARLYQGAVTGDASVNANDNSFSVRYMLSNIQIQPLLKDAIDKDFIDGRGSLKLNLNTQGKVITQIKNNLDGEIAVNLADGAIKGFNLAKSLRDFKAKIGAKSDQEQTSNVAEKTDFSALSASLHFVDGVGNSDDLSIKSPFLRGGGSGNVNLRNSSLDYVAKVTVVNTSTGQDGADLSQLKDISIPIRISGPFDKVTYKIQFSQIGSDALKAAFKTKAAPILEEKKKELKEKVNEQLKDKLKGLFGK